MPRYKITVAYEGTDFHGWQRQEPPEKEPLRTVQGVLHESVELVVREPVVLNGSSRTDAGVHATGQVAAFSTSREIPVERMPRAITARCPEDLQVLEASLVPDHFDPISHATSKCYSYMIQHGPELPPLFDRRTIWRTHHTLDPERMRVGAGRLVGTHDFEPFAAASHGRESSIRTITDCTITEVSENRVRIDVTGDGFLYNMVRIIAGSLLEIGRGAREPDSIDKAIAERNRTLTGPTLGPSGLTLCWIRHEIPATRESDGNQAAEESQ